MWPSGRRARIAAGYGFYGGGGVVFFDARGERLRPTPLEVKEGYVTSVAFGPEGRIAAGYEGGGGGGVVLFDARGERLRPTPLEVKEGSVTSVAFGPEGRIAAGYEGGGGGGVVLFDAGGERLRPTHKNLKEKIIEKFFDALGKRLRPTPLEVEGKVNSVAFGPEGKIAAGYEGGGGGGVVLFDARGERLRPAPLEVKEGDVTSVAFGPEGQIAAGYGFFGGGGGVVLFDARGERLRPTPLEVKEGKVNSVAFGPEGRIAAGYGVYGGGGVVLFDAGGERLRPAPLEVKEGDVTSLAFGPEGQIAAGYGARDVSGLLDVDVGGVVLFDARGERLRPAPLEVKEGKVNSVAFGPEGQIAAGYSGRFGVGFGDVDGVVLFDARGERLRPTPLEWRSRRAVSRAWPSGRRARSPRDIASATTDGGVVLFDAGGERLRPAPLEVKEGSVESVAFGPEGQIAAGYGVFGGGVFGGGGGVVLFDARGERLRPTPLEVKEGDVTSLAFGPEGRIAAGYGAAAWCSSTPGASGSDPRRWRSRRAVSRAWPSGRRARSPRDMASSAAAAAWCSSTPIPPRGCGRRGRQPTATSRGSSGRGTSPIPPTAARSDPCLGRMISPRLNGSRPRCSRRNTPRGARRHEPSLRHPDPRRRRHHGGVCRLGPGNCGKAVGSEDRGLQLSRRNGAAPPKPIDFCHDHFGFPSIRARTLAEAHSPPGMVTVDASRLGGRFALTASSSCSRGPK